MARARARAMILALAALGGCLAVWIALGVRRSAPGDATNDAGEPPPAAPRCAAGRRAAVRGCAPSQQLVGREVRAGAEPEAVEVALRRE